MLRTASQPAQEQSTSVGEPGPGPSSQLQAGGRAYNSPPPSQAVGSDGFDMYHHRDDAEQDGDGMEADEAEQQPPQPQVDLKRCSFIEVCVSPLFPSCIAYG